MFAILKNKTIKIMKDIELINRYSNQLNFFLIKMYKISINETEKKT